MKIQKISLLLACSVLFVGCATNSSVRIQSNTLDNSIVGHWKSQSSEDDIFIDFNEYGTFVTNLKVYNLSQDSGVYRIEGDVLELFYASRDEVDIQAHKPTVTAPVSDSIYLHRVIEDELYLAMMIAYDPDRSIDDIIEAQDRGLLRFTRIVS